MRHRVRRCTSDDSSKLNPVQVETTIILLSSAIDSIIRTKDDMFENTYALAKALKPVVDQYKEKQRLIYSRGKHNSYRDRLRAYVNSAVETKLPKVTVHHLVMHAITATLITTENQIGKFLDNVYYDLYRKHTDAIDVYYKDNKHLTKTYTEHQYAINAIYNATIVDDMKQTHQTKVRKGLFYKPKIIQVQKAKVIYLTKNKDKLCEGYKNTLTELEKLYDSELLSYLDGDSTVIQNILDYIESIIPDTVSMDLVAKTIMNKLSDEYLLPTTKFIFDAVEAKKLHREVKQCNNDEVAIESLKVNLNNCMEYAVYAKSF